jgi:hypothetical protein
MKRAYALWASPLISPEPHVTLTHYCTRHVLNTHSLTHSLTHVISCVKMLHVRYKLEQVFMHSTYVKSVYARK